ncbi:MAG: hypothetical protein ACFCUL_00670 [Flavobacteriaceae bacterium]
MTDNFKRTKARRKLIIETTFAFFIAISPFLYKLYDYLPDNPEATISIFGLVIDNNGFRDISTYAWFMMSKIVPLYLMIFWFMTSKNWWYHIILIPIAMYSFQVFEVLFDSDDNIDTENIWWLLPICMTVIPFVYFIRIKLFDKHVHGIDLEAMEAELKALKEKRKHTESFNREVKSPETIEYLSLSEKINQVLSTGNLENQFRNFQHRIRNIAHLKL